nr:DUF4302 domain-containing protein [Pedobacter sp. ASV19]
MKKIIYILLVVVAFITSCKKDQDPIFDDPDTRLAKALDADKSQITSATNGWKAMIYPKGGKGFSFYFLFGTDGKVKMLSDFNASTATTLQESTYRLKALQRPTLIFDTYNYIHLAADPDASVSGGASATGLASDFEFAFASVAGDSIKMEGTFNGNKMVMIKLGAEESKSILDGGLKTMNDANTAYLLVNKNPYLLFADGTKGAVLIDPVAKTLKLNYLDSKEVSQLQTVKYAYGINKITLSGYLTYGNVRFNELFYDPAQKIYYIMSGTTRINVQNSVTPIIPLRTLFMPVGKDYSQIEYNPNNVQVNLSSDFNAKYNAAKTGLAAVGNAGRTLDAVRVIINVDNTMSLRYYYHNTSNSNFQANMTYSYTRDASGAYSFVYLADDGNAAVVGGGLTALKDYFSKNSFKVDWVVNPNGGAPYGGFYTTADQASFFYGTLIK